MKQISSSSSLSNGIVISEHNEVAVVSLFFAIIIQQAQ